MKDVTANQYPVFTKTQDGVTKRLRFMFLEEFFKSEIADAGAMMEVSFTDGPTVERNQFRTKMLAALEGNEAVGHKIIRDEDTLRPISILIYKKGEVGNMDYIKRAHLINKRRAISEEEHRKLNLQKIHAEEYWRPIHERQVKRKRLKRKMFSFLSKAAAAILVCAALTSVSAATLTGVNYFYYRDSAVSCYKMNGIYFPFNNTCIPLRR